MKNFIKISAILLVIMVVLAITTEVQAASFSINLNSSASNIKAGDTVTLYAKVSNFADVGSGINALLAQIEYDSNIFETLEKAGIAEQNSWDGLTYNSAKGKLVITNDSFVSEPEDIIAITLKVKNGVSEGNTTVSLKDIEASNGSEDIKASNTSVVFSVKGAGGSESEDNKNNPVVVIKDNSITNKSNLPYTGESSVATIAVMIGIVIAVNIYFTYKQYSKIN